MIEFGIPVELKAVLAYPVEELEDLHARHRLAPDDVTYRRRLGHAQHQAVGEVARGGGGSGGGRGRQKQRCHHHCSYEATVKRRYSRKLLKTMKV